MYTRIYWLHQFSNAAKLGIMARPRGGDWLNQEIIQLKKQGVQLLVSLLEQQEITELGLNAEQKTCTDNSIEYVNFPIIDRSIPASTEKAKTLIATLSEKINTGSTVVIHCRMGIGRSSIMAACLLLKEGYKPGEVLTHISKVRGLKVPDTEEQERWLKRI